MGQKRAPSAPLSDGLHPAQYSLAAALNLLRDVLSERRLMNSRIGLELGFVTAADFPAITALPIEWADCTRLVERLRAVKCAGRTCKPHRSDHARHDGSAHDGNLESRGVCRS